jgi:hypothetical protein
MQCWQFPVAIVWIVGIIVAVKRWRIHPRVSATVVASLSCMLSALVGRQIFYAFLLPGLRPKSEIVIYLQIANTLAGLIGGIGWALILLASFGWRDANLPGRGNPVQFSIRGLLVVTLVVAVLCGLIRGVAEVLGPSATMLWGLLYYLPAGICWYFGGWASFTRRHLHPEVSWRVGIVIGLQCISLSLTIAVIAWLVGSAATPGLGALLVLIWFVADPASWVLLLIAAFGWRTKPADTEGNPFRAAAA